MTVNVMRMWNTARERPKQHSLLTLEGGCWAALNGDFPRPGCLPCPSRQLLDVDDTLVANVDTLRVLVLLYRVKADVEVLVLDIELRQLFDAIELALDARGRPLRVLVGDAPRRSTL